MPLENPDYKNMIRGFIGRKYEGKSTRLTEFLVQRERVIVIDPNGEHVEWNPNELESLPELREFFQWNRKKPEWAAAFIPGENIEDDVSEACRVIWNSGGDCTVAFDEITEYSSANHAPRSFLRIARRGRHRRMDVFYTSLRFAESPRKLTAQTDEFYLFAQTEPDDIWGKNGIDKRCGRETAELVERLGEHEYLIWRIRDGLVYVPERLRVAAAAGKAS